jgi:hypothetical protein
VPSFFTLFDISKDFKFQPKIDYERIHINTSSLFGEYIGQETRNVAKGDDGSFDINDLERKMSPFTGSIRNILTRHKDAKKIICEMLYSFVDGFSRVTAHTVHQAIVSRCFVR